MAKLPEAHANDDGVAVLADCRGPVLDNPMAVLLEAIEDIKAGSRDDDGAVVEIGIVTVDAAGRPGWVFSNGCSAAMVGALTLARDSVSTAVLEALERDKD